MARSFLARRWNQRLSIIPPKSAEGPTPTVTSITPDIGLTVGGMPVTIIGTNFVDGAKAFLGSAPVLDLVFVNETTLTGVVPARPPGIVNLTVVNPAGHYDMLPGAFTFAWAIGHPILTELGDPLLAQVNGVATEALLLE